MKINFNGVTREMTEREINAFEEENRLLENDKTQSDISERVKKLEKDRYNTATELASIREALNVIKAVVTALDKTNQEKA